ncbi:MAG: Coenzyme F420 hydrogenase/dehydrogenase, beta subunit C-terminal domain [Thermoguttaceae bacterium]|nr:Coenzyme F420 hydrogenase/dehydrogenase, beta subunit C-terminal domain [Thermoguttaceae bacterium]
MTRISNEKKEQCSGCGACATACPTQAITYAYDDEGFLAPSVDEKLCVNCGKCVKFCHLQGENSGKGKKVVGQYAAKIKDEKIRANSRSGGVFTALSDFILERGGVVYGAALLGVEKVEHIRAETPDERDKMRGSKYVQSDTTRIWEAFKRDVADGRPVLFTGSPCQTQAARLIIGGERDNVYLCDFVCHGVPSPILWRDYISFMEKKYRRTLAAFDFRDKREHSWESHVEGLTFVDQKTVYSRRYTNLFYSNECLRESCYACPYTTSERTSDFTIADYWGIDSVAAEFNDSKGVSLLLVRGERGEKALDAVKERLDLIDTSHTPPPHNNLQRSTSRPETRDAFWEDYRKYGFKYVSVKYGRYDALRKIKYKIFDKLS